jgi:DNA invertase Pin-like site-specific DNA recombinase
VLQIAAMKYGYVRVSTKDQNADMQHRALKRAGCRVIFEDGLSGATMQRPALRRCLKKLQRGDTLTVWKLDRLARSLRDLVFLADDFQQRGIQLRSLTEEINTATPGGKLLYGVLAALAEFERGVIRERTGEGMRAARARGVKFGPKLKLTAAQIAHGNQLIRQGRAVPEVAALLRVSRATIYRQCDVAKMAA